MVNVVVERVLSSVGSSIPRSSKLYIAILFKVCVGVGVSEKDSQTQSLKINFADYLYNLVIVLIIASEIKQVV